MIVSMWLGNMMLLVLNLPLIGIWVKMLLVPYRLLAVAIMFFCCIGVYSLNNLHTEVYFMALFGVLGYLFIKLGCEPAPLLLGLPARAADGGLHASRHAAVARRSAGCSCSGRCRSRSSQLPRCCCCSSCCPTCAKRGKQLSRSELTAPGSARILTKQDRPYQGGFTCVVASSWGWPEQRWPPAFPRRPRRRHRAGRSGPSSSSCPMRRAAPPTPSAAPGPTSSPRPSASSS